MSGLAIAVLPSIGMFVANFLEVAVNSPKVVATGVESFGDWARYLEGYSKVEVDILHNWMDMGVVIDYQMHKN